jgi:hypothetical protein
MKQEKRLPALLQEKNLNGSKGYSPLVPEQKSDVNKEITQVSKDVKELVKETKKGTKALTSIEKILKKSSEERQDTKKELNVEKKQEQLATPIVKSTQGKQQASQSGEEPNKEEKNPAQLELDLGIPEGKKSPSGKVGTLGRGAAAIGRAATAVAPVAGVAAIASLPFIGAAVQKRKIDEDPNAPGLEFNPYAMEKRGETDASGKPLTAGRAGRLNARRAAGSVRWGEINQAVESDLTDEELFTQYGRNREDLKKWLSENKDGKNFYDINTKAPAVADREPIKNIKPPEPEMGPPREVFEQKRAEVNQAADKAAAEQTLQESGYSTVTGRGAMKPGAKEMQPADFEEAVQAQAAREAVQRGLQQRRRGGTGRGDVPVPPRPDTVELTPETKPVEATPVPAPETKPVEATPVPAQETKPVEEGIAPASVSTAPNAGWEQVKRGYESGFTPVSHLEKALPGIEAEFIRLANSSAPRSSSVMSIQGHERRLAALAKKNMEEKNAKSVEAVPAQAMAAGGLVISPNEEKTSNKYGTGGLIKGPGGDKTDSIAAYNKDSGRPIALSNNEYIMPADVTKEVGKGVLDAIVQDPNALKRAEGGDTEGKVKGYFQLKGQVESLKKLQEDSGRNTLVDVDQKTLDAQQVFIKKLDDMKSELLKAGYSSQFLEDANTNSTSVVGSRTSKYSDDLLTQSSQNKELSSEMSSGGAIQPIVIQNNNSTNTQTAIPIKAEPRMQSSFTRFNDSRASY